MGILTYFEGVGEGDAPCLAGHEAGGYKEDLCVTEGGAFPCQGLRATSTGNSASSTLPEMGGNSRATSRAAASNMLSSSSRS